MGINTKAIEKIDEQIRMLEDEPFDDDSNSDTYDVEVLDDSSDESIEDVTNEIVEDITEDTVKLDSIDDIDKTEEIETIDEDDSTTMELENAKDLTEPVKDVELEDDEEGLNIFLIYYIGIVIVAIILIVIIYFLFR